MLYSIAKAYTLYQGDRIQHTISASNKENETKKSTSISQRTPCLFLRHPKDQVTKSNGKGVYLAK